MNDGGLKLELASLTLVKMYHSSYAQLNRSLWNQAEFLMIQCNQG